MTHRGNPLSQAFPQRRHFLAATACFVLFAAYGSLVPWEVVPLSFGDAVQRFKELPLFEIGIGSRADWVANVLLFVPIGFCAMATFVVDRPSQMWRYLAGGASIWIGCGAVTIAIEFSQSWFPTRVASAYDIQAQSLGAALGIALAWMAANPLARWLRTATSSRRASSRLAWLLQVYVAGLIVYQVLPLDITIHPREIWEKYKLGRIEFVPFVSWQWGLEALAGVATDMALHVPLGAWCAIGPLARIGWRGAWAILCGGAIVVMCELSQVFVYSRYTSTTDVLVATVGVAIGSGMAIRATKRREAVSEAASEEARDASGGFFWFAVLGFCLAYVAYLFAIYCQPFEVLTDSRRIDLRFRNFFCVPFSKLYWGTEFNAVSQMLGKIITFLPLGVVAAVAIRRATFRSRSRRIASVLCVVLAAMLGCAIELAQTFFPPHFPDVTDVLFYTTGVAVGLLAGHYVLSGAGSSSEDADRTESRAARDIVQ